MKKINEYIIEKININLTSLDNLQEIIDEYNLEQNLIKANIISDFDLKQIYAEMFHIECFSYELRFEKTYYRKILSVFKNFFQNARSV